METKMRAMVIPKFGGPDVFELRDVEKPVPKTGQVLVKIISSSVNPVDTKVRENGYWSQIDVPAVIGYDAAGIIEGVGEGVTKFRKGDTVYYTPEIANNQLGTYAEYNIVNASIVSKKPDNLTFDEAASIPLAGGTAWEGIVRRLKLIPGETVLIHGAAGGVGTFAVQFAKASGAKVVATASKEHHEGLRKLGADEVIDYHETDAADFVLKFTHGLGVDAAFDIQGDNIGSRCLPGIRSFGRIAVILPPSGDFSLLTLKNITMYGIYEYRDSKRLDEMRPVFENRLAYPVIENVLPLEEVSKAHERLEKHHGWGKIVLSVSG
jgi:NADPH:quinone reductase